MTMPHFWVRRATEADIPDIVEMGRQLHADSNFANMVFDPDMAADHVRRFVDSDWCCVLLAVDSRRTLGFVSGQLGRAMFGPELIAQEDLFFVKPDVRGTKAGVARMLLRDFCYWAADHGPARISIDNTAGADDDKFQRLLQSCGFERAGSVMIMRIG